MYVAYVCLICGCEFAISTEGLKCAEIAGKYIACNFGHTHIKRIGRFDSLKRCMQEQDTYKRTHGVVKQL